MYSILIYALIFQFLKLTLYTSIIKPKNKKLFMHNARVIIADDHHLFILGLKTILNEAEGHVFTIVGTAHTGDSLLELLKRTPTELLLLDLNMPEGNGLDVLNVIKEQYPTLKIIALTMYDDPKIVKSTFKSGVDGYILKNVGISELIKGIVEVLDGKAYLGKGVSLNGFMDDPAKKQDQIYFEDRFIKKFNLTKREIEILRLITQALSNKQIAKELYISDQTVSVHRKNIMRKLGVSNTAGLLKLAYDNSLI